jgi:hypothetical protein
MAHSEIYVDYGDPNALPCHLSGAPQARRHVTLSGAPHGA